MKYIYLHENQFTFSTEKIMKIKKPDGKSTWAMFGVAGHCLLQSRTHLSSVYRFFDDLSFSHFGSTAASHTAFTPFFPIANLAVNPCNYKHVPFMDLKLGPEEKSPEGSGKI